MITSILIIKRGAMGDVVRATALLHLLRNRHPASRIDWIVDSESVDLLRNNPFLRNIYVWGSYQTQQWDLIVNLEDTEECARFATQHGRIVIGTHMMGDILTYTPSGWFDMSLVSTLGRERANALKRANTKTYYQHLYELLGATWSGEKPVLVLSDDEREQGRQLIKQFRTQDKPLIGINAFAGGRWKHKSLPEERTVALIKMLSLQGCTCVLFGDQDRNARVAAMTDIAIPLVDTSSSPRLFAAAIASCDIVITSDSLALHLATVVGTPVVAFFGPTPAPEIELFGGHKVVPPMKCISCLLHDCDVPVPCSSRFDLDEICAATKRLLRMRNAGERR